MNSVVELVRKPSIANEDILIETVEKSILARFKNKKIKNVMLVTPPDADISFFDLDYAKRKRYANYPPYGTLLLARRLLNEGINVEIVNLQHEILKAAFSATKGDFDYDTTWKKKIFLLLTRRLGPWGFY